MTTSPPKYNDRRTSGHIGASVSVARRTGARLLHEARKAAPRTIFFFADLNFIGELLQTFQEYPQRQKAASFNLDEVLARMQQGSHQA